jgi:hypothetical protein
MKPSCCSHLALEVWIIKRWKHEGHEQYQPRGKIRMESNNIFSSEENRKHLIANLYENKKLKDLIVNMNMGLSPSSKLVQHHMIPERLQKNP